MIIYGSGMYFKSDVVHSYGDCEHCGNYANQKSYRARKFGHIYWIPLIPMGPKLQVLRECSSCNLGAHIPVDHLDERVVELKDRFKSWIVSVQEGQTEIQLGGAEQGREHSDQHGAENGENSGEPESINAGLLIASMLEDLYCLNEIGDINAISEILCASEMQYEESIVRGRWYELQGDLQGASNCYKEALNLRPEETMPLYQIGTIASKLGNVAEAENALQQYLQKVPDDLGAVIELAGMYERQKDYPKIVDAYDKLYEMRPELRDDRGMSKVYKKACKKSGRPVR